MQIDYKVTLPENDYLSSKEKEIIVDRLLDRTVDHFNFHEKWKLKSLVHFCNTGKFLTEESK
jgi:hypothetical protein